MEIDVRYSSFIYMKKLLMVIGSFSGAVSMLLFFSERFAEFFGGLFEINLFGVFGGALATSFLIVSVFSFAFVYLQSGGDRGEFSVSKGGVDADYVNKIGRVLEDGERQRKDISEKLEALTCRVKDSDSSKELTAEERESVIAGVIASSGSDAIKLIFAEETHRLEAQLSSSLSLEGLSVASKRSMGRLMREISDLRLRSNINLLIGMAITGVGLWLLWSTVSMIDASELLRNLASEGQDSDTKFLKNLTLPLIPRILLVVFVEIFAYFFLRLYRNGLSEIKYFQNELTNVESKLTAIEFAYVTKSNGALKEAIAALAKTERNFILEKGQTTVELERAKSESELMRNIAKSFPKIFEREKK